MTGDSPASATPFRAALRRTGGFAGITRTASITDDPADPDAAAVRAVLPTESELAALGDPSGAPAPPDAYTYELDIEVGAARRRLTYSDLDLPEVLRPLVTLLARRAGRR
jgi:hypothetical protein